MTELLGFTFLVVAGVASLSALLTTVELLLPERANRARHVIEIMSGRVFIIGLVNLIFFGIIAAVLGQGGDFMGLIALLILLALLGLTIVGLTGILALLRQRIFQAADQESSLLSKRLKTAIILVMALITPVAGWFILTPILATLGLGAGIMSLMRRSSIRETDASY